MVIEFVIYRQTAILLLLLNDFIFRDPRILLPIKKYVKPVENKDTKTSEKSKIAKSTYSVNKSESSALLRTKLSPLFFDSKIRDSGIVILYHFI